MMDSTAVSGMALATGSGVMPAASVLRLIKSKSRLATGPTRNRGSFSDVERLHQTCFSAHRQFDVTAIVKFNPPELFKVAFRSAKVAIDAAFAERKPAMIVPKVLNETSVLHLEIRNNRHTAKRFFMSPNTQRQESRINGKWRADERNWFTIEG